MEWYETLPVSIVAGAVGAYIINWLSLVRFYRERAWQKQFEACADVVSALHDLDRMNELWLSERIADRDYLPEYRADILKQGEEALRSLRRYADLGPLALPRSVSSVVQQFVRDNAHALHVDDPADVVPAVLLSRRLIGDALETIPPAAAASLGLTEGNKLSFSRLRRSLARPFRKTPLD